MSVIDAIRHRLSVLLNGASYARQVDEEMRFHLEQQAMHERHAGRDAEAARFAARKAFGNVTYAREEVRRMSGWSAVDGTMMDLRATLRALRRTPAFVAVAVLSLAIGIGANATVFSWMEGLVLNPYPAVRDVGRVVSLQLSTPHGTSTSFSYPAFVSLSRRVSSLEKLAVFNIYQFGVQDANATGPAEPVWGAFASTEYFSALGVRMQLGRAFLPDDSAGSAQPVMVISDAFWRHHFAGDSSVIGRQVRLNGHEATVIGVAPADFTGSYAALGFDIWTPVTGFEQIGNYSGKLRERTSQWLDVFGRIRPGITPEQLNAELARISPQLEEEDPDVFKGATMTSTPFVNGVARHILAPLFGALLGVTVLVLIIVCANLANLLLARAAARGHELGVRAAIGASSTRLARHLMLESALLAAPGAALGIGVASWGRRALSSFLPKVSLPMHLDTPLDARVLAFVITVTVTATLLFGLVPALRYSRPDLSTVLRAGGRAGPARSRLRGIFVVVQVALSLVALISAALFVRSLMALQRVDPGFRDSDHVLLVGTDFGFAGVRDAATMRTQIDRILERTRALPGVTSAAAADFVPMGLSGGDSWSVEVPGYARPRGETNFYSVNRVTPDYFATMGIPVLQGRAFNSSDQSVSGRSLIVNEAFVRRYFPGRDPIGQRVAIGSAKVPNATIVGVVKNGIYDFTDPQTGIPPFMYLPYAAAATRNVVIHVHTRGDAIAMIPAIRRAMTEVAPSLPLISPLTLTEWSQSAFFLQRIGATVLGALGGVALLLAALGLYAVTSYSVSQRTREVGIRMALGAAHRTVIVTFLREGMRVTMIGVAVGALGALAAGRLLASQLYGVRPVDPLAFGSVAGVLCATALVATWIPARRAAHVDPMVALRGE